MNKILLTGRVGADPQKKVITNKENGKQTIKATFNIAFKQSYNEEQIQWIRVETFGSLAEKLIIPYIKKGQLILIEGKLVISSVNDKHYYSINAQNIEILSKKENDTVELENNTIENDTVVANTVDEEYEGLIL